MFVKQVSEIIADPGQQLVMARNDHPVYLISISCQVSAPIILLRFVAFLSSRKRAGADRSAVWSTLIKDKIFFFCDFFILLPECVEILETIELQKMREKSCGDPARDSCVKTLETVGMPCHHQELGRNRQNTGQTVFPPNLARADVRADHKSLERIKQF